MRIGSLFAGYDGIGLAVEALWPDAERAWFVEFDQAPSKILAHHWPTVVNHGDITAVDWDAVEPVDILTGGFPCQDLSHAGKRLGLRPGTRSGLWEHMAYAIDRLRPRLVVIENVRGLLSAEAHSDMERDCWCVGDEREPALRALGAVLGDLAELGYDARWGGVRAADAGAPHGRFRIFIVAYPADIGLDTGTGGPGAESTTARRGPGTTADADLAGLEGRPAERQRADQRPARPSGVGPVALLPTPSAADGLGGHESRGGDRGHERLPLANFGPYAAAIARWEAVLGRPAPSPTEPGKDGRPRLSPLFVEWMMGLPLGHVTDPAIGLTRAQALKVLGNGVVPQQAALALRMLLGLGGAVADSDAAGLLRTPQANLTEAKPGIKLSGRTTPSDPQVGLADQVLALLPTPAVNDMGAGKTPEDWDRWTDDMKARHGNGNGHGKSLAIEAMRLGGSNE